MIIMCTCMGIAGFLAHTAIKAVLDVLIAILFVLSVLGNIISGIISIVYFGIMLIVDAIFAVISGVWEFIPLIIFNIPVVNVIAFTCGIWFFQIISLVLGGTGWFSDIIFLFVGHIFEIPRVIASIGTESLLAILTAIRTAFAPLSFMLLPTALIKQLTHVSLLLKSYALIYASSLANAVGDTAIISPFGSVSLWAQAGVRFVGAVANIIMLGYEIIGGGGTLIGGFGAYTVEYLISIPLDLILSGIVFIGGGFFAGILGTI